MRTEFTPGNSPTLSGTSGVDVHILHVEGGEVLLPSREVMLEGMYARSGADLVITSPEDGKFVVKGFFLSDTPPKLTDGGDTQISGEMAAAFAGPIGLDQYAGQTNAAGASIGQVRSLIGVATVTRADGTVVTLKVGDPLYLDDTIETTAGAQIGLILIDGTALALGEKGELVLDDLVYDPSTKNGKAALSLVSGAAEFVSGSIAKSGQDNMTFKTPVGTIGIRGTKVFAQYDPVTGEITILNRPTGTGANGQPIAGEIVLTLPNGQVIGSITGGDAGWRWNAAQGQTPQQVQFTPAQVQGLVAGVQATVNNLQQIQQQQQNNNNTGTPGGDNSGGQGGGQGNGDGQGGNGNGQGQGNTTTGDAGTATTVTANNVVVTTTTIAPGTTQTTFNIGAALVVTNNVTTANPLGTAGTVIGATPGTTIGTIVTPPSPPPPPPNAVVTVTGGGTVTDQTATAVEFTITRSVNTTNTFTVTYTIGGGTATAGTDYVGGSGTLTFAPNELSKTISVPILTNGRTEEAETFSLTLTGATGGTTIAGGPANVTIAADLDLPTISIGNATALDNVAGTVTLKVTRDGAVYAPSTVSYTTVASGLAQAGSDFTAQTGTVTFAANQKEAFITIPILANSTPLTPANREDDETFTVVLSGATDARITGDTGTVTIGADPALASFSISAVGAGEGGTAMITITRSGALGSTVSVNYAAVNGEATAGSDFTGVSGTATFGPQDLSITIPISITLDDDTEGGESFTVVLSNPTGGFIADGGGSATVNIDADPIPIKIVIGPPTTIFGAYADNAYVQIAGPGKEISTNSNLAVSTHTFEAWIRPANMNAGAASGDPQTIASILGTNCMFLTYETNHKIKVKIGVGSDERVLESSVTVGSDAWHHVAYSYNNATGEIKLYIDGVQDTNATYLATDTINFASSDPLTIGGGLTPYQGGVDEVRVWNTVRTPAEINNNFHFQFDTAPSNLLIQHVFENYVGGVYPNSGSGGTAFDMTGGGYHSPHDGEKSVIFTGTTHITTDIVGGLPGFTLQANIRLLGTAGIDLPIMSKPTVANGTDDTFEFQLFIDATNHVVLRMGRTDSMVTELISGDPLLPGIAYDISATFNPQMSQVDLFVNGELVDTDSFMGSLRRFGNLPIDIGHINDDSGDQYFNGLINTVRIWGLPIPSMLIDDIDSMGALPDANGLIAHFGFVDGSGTAVTDLSGNGHAATITGGTPIWIFDGPLVTHVFDGMEDLQEDGVASVQFVGAPGTPGATLTYSIASGPSHGTLTITAGGYAIYKPTLNYVGADSFTILLTDSANGTTTQVVNLDIEAVNDRPKIALQTTLPSVVVNDPSPVGYTINSQFGGSFVDPDGSFEGVVVLGYTANPTGQGSWQYSTDGSNWYSFGAINVASTQLFLTKDTLVRFLPDMGYSGNPAGLILKAVDDSYTGSFTVGASTVSIATAGAPFLLSEKSSAIFVQVVPPVEFDGGVDDNWDVAMNWNPDVVPTSTSAVSISGSFSVTLNNGNNTTGANAINSLVMGGTAVLALESATRLTINSSGFVGATSSIDIKGSSRLAGPGTLENHGIINVMGIGYLSLVGELHNYGGEINVGDGSSNSTLFMTEDVSNEAISPGRMTPAGIINILTNSDYDSLFSVTNSSTLTNHGDIILSSEDTDGGNGHTATLDANGGTLINYGIIRAEDGELSGGSRVLEGDIRNQNSGTLDIDTDTEYASGTLANSGNIFIASGASLTIQSGATLVLDSGTDLSDNTVNSNGVLVIANGGTLAVKAPVTIDEGAQIYMGDYASGGTPALLHQDASYSGGSGSVPLQLRGELGLDRALVDLKIEVQSPGLIEILNSNQVTFTKDLVITIGGEFDIYGSSAAAGVTFNSAQLNNSGGSVTFMASGGNTVTYTGTGGSVSNSGSMILGVSGGTVNFNSTGTVTNTQGGEFRTQGGGTINMSVATFNNSSSGSGGSIQINTDTGFTGTLNNSKNIYVGTGSKFTITSGSTLANNSSSAEYQSFGSGGGILFIDTGATFSTSSNLTIGGGLTVDLGVASSGGAATWNSGGNTVLVEGRVNMNHVEATVALDVQSGGKVYFTNSNDISYVYLNSQVSGGGQLHVDALTSNSRGTFAGANLTNIGTITLNANSGFEASLFLTNGGSGGFLDNTSGAVIQTMGAGTARIRAEDQVWIENGSSFNVFTNTSVVGGPLINLGGTITVSDDTNNGMSTTLTLDSFQDKAGLVNLSSSGGNTDIPRIAVTSAALLGGVLALNADVFTTATTGSISNVITWGSGQRTGMFDDIQGLVLGTNMGDHVLDPIFTSTGLNFDVLTVGNNTPSSGNDVLIGTGGADMINGGAGDDFIYGGLGDDVLIAGGGSNRLIGGGGLDTADYSGTDVITANLANGSVTGAAAADTLIGVENLIGSSNGDDITGDHHVNDLKGGGGADIIRGGAGNDLLYGEADGDMLFGENGDDKLIGGAGVDTMTGGMGNDQFILNAPADGSDIYVDFTSGEDTIILLEGAPMIFDLAMSSGPIQDGVNFSIISVAFDGTNGEAGGATNTNFANADPTLVYSTFDNTLYYDDDGVGSGFTVLAQLQTGTVAATDIQFYTFGSVVV